MFPFWIKTLHCQILNTCSGFLQAFLFCPVHTGSRGARKEQHTNEWNTFVANWSVHTGHNQDKRLCDQMIKEQICVIA